MTIFIELTQGFDPLQWKRYFCFQKSNFENSSRGKHLNSEKENPKEKLKYNVR